MVSPFFKGELEGVGCSIQLLFYVIPDCKLEIWNLYNSFWIPR